MTDIQFKETLKECFKTENPTVKTDFDRYLKTIKEHSIKPKTEIQRRNMSREGYTKLHIIPKEWFRINKEDLYTKKEYETSQNTAYFKSRPYIYLKRLQISMFNQIQPNVAKRILENLRQILDINNKGLENSICYKISHGINLDEKDLTMLETILTDRYRMRENNNGKKKKNLR